MAISLASLSKSHFRPPRVIIHAEPGIGKTTFCASAPAPVFIQTEDGLGNLEVDAFPLATSFEEVLEAIGVLYSEDHHFQTLCVDSLDWMEGLIWRRVCKAHKVDNVEAIPYGKAYIEALVHWRQFFDGITALRDQKGMVVLMTAHSQITRVEDPSLPTYDMRSLKLHKRASALAEEFADVILYASVQTNTVTEDAGFNTKRIRATTTGARVMHTVGQPAFLAKNRYSLPSPLPLAWDAFAGAMWPPAAPAAKP